MITTVFFDIGNVLFGFNHALIWQRLADFTSVPPNEMAQRIRAAQLWPLHETGQMGPAPFFRQIAALLNLNDDLSFDLFCTQWADIFAELTPMVNLACALQTRYAVGLLSNIGQLHWDWLAQRYAFFHTVPPALRVLSFQVGHLKPSRAIYEYAVQHAHAVPSACVYIDDIPEFAAASREFGLHGIHFQTVAQVIDDLRALGVRVE